MEESLQRMEVELRLLRKKYFFLQETIDSKVDGHVKNLLEELEEAFVERALEKVLAKLNSSVAVVQSECFEVDDDVGRIQLQSAGEMNGEMIAANVKQEPVDYDETNYDDVYDNHYSDSPDEPDEISTFPEIYEDSSLVINGYTGSHFLSDAQEEDTVESSGINESEVNYGMPGPLREPDYMSESVVDNLPVLLKEKIGVKNSSREKTSVKNPPKERTIVKNPPRERANAKDPPREKISSVKNSPRDKTSVKSLSKERTPILSEDTIMKIGYEGVKRKTAKSSKKKGVKCQDCDLVFVTESRLRRHMVTHMNARPFKCSLCYKSYKVKSHLTRHIKDSHPGTTIPITVNSKQSRKYSKELHVESPAKTENKTKSQSKAETKVRAAKLDLPIEVSGTKNNYDCSICGKHFSYPSHLKPHLLGHARKLAKQGMTV